jgi:hypothetical protein
MHLITHENVLVLRKPENIPAGSDSPGQRSGRAAAGGCRERVLSLGLEDRSGTDALVTKDVEIAPRQGQPGVVDLGREWVARPRSALVVATLDGHGAVGLMAADSPDPRGFCRLPKTPLPVRRWAGVRMGQRKLPPMRIC